MSQAAKVHVNDANENQDTTDAAASSSTTADKTNQELKIAQVHPNPSNTKGTQKTAKSPEQIEHDTRVRLGAVGRRRAIIAIPDANEDQQDSYWHEEPKQPKTRLISVWWPPVPH